VLCAATNVANIIIGHRNVSGMYAHTMPKAIQCINVKQVKKIIDVLTASTTISTTKQRKSV